MQRYLMKRRAEHIALCRGEPGVSELGKDNPLGVGDRSEAGDRGRVYG